MDNKYLKKFKRCILEYTNAAGSFDISEDEEEGMMPQSEEGDGEMGNNFNSMTANEEPPMSGEMPTDGENGVEGFDPEGEPNADGAEMQNSMDNISSEEPTEDIMQPDDEVIDVDDLTKSQESAEHKIDKMNAKFEKLMGAVEMLIKKNNEYEKSIADAIAASEKKVSDELNKRIPTPQQRMSMRSTKSAPYSMTPNEYMSNYAPDNYSDEDDNNGVNDEQYKITKGDIDSFVDYASIAKDLDIEHQNLHNILGY